MRGAACSEVDGIGVEDLWFGCGTSKRWDCREVLICDYGEHHREHRKCKGGLPEERPAFFLRLRLWMRGYFGYRRRSRLGQIRQQGFCLSDKRRSGADIEGAFLTAEHM